MARKSFSTSPQVNGFPDTCNLQPLTKESLSTPVVKIFPPTVMLSVLVKVFTEPEASDSPADVWLLPGYMAWSSVRSKMSFKPGTHFSQGSVFWVGGSALGVLSWSFPPTETLLRRGLLVLCATATVQGCCKCTILRHHFMAQETLCLVKEPPLPQDK